MSRSNATDSRGPLMADAEEELYTLEQARREIAARECDQFGCLVSVHMTIRGYDGLLKLRTYECTRCGVEYVQKR